MLKKMALQHVKMMIHSNHNVLTSVNWSETRKTYKEIVRLNRLLHNPQVSVVKH